MGQIDSRFLNNVSRLFAPKIHEGQTFTAYMDSDNNSFTVQTDNIIGNSMSIDTAKINKLSQDVEDAARTANTILQQCNEMLSTLRGVSAFATEIENLSGDESGQVDFAFASLAEDVATLRAEISDLNSGSDSSTDEYTLEEIQYQIDDLSSSVDKLNNKEYITNNYYQFITSTENDV